MYFSENIIKIMDEICNKIGISIDWGSKNVLPYLEQLSKNIIKYEITIDSLYLVFGMIMLILGVLIWVGWYRESEKSLFTAMGDFSISVGAALIIIGFILSLDCIEGIIVAKTIPEKTVIDFIMEYKN